MLQYFIKRLFAMIPKLLIITILIFAGLELVPGDALSRSMPYEEYAKLNEIQREEMRENLGLNDPAVKRYFHWIANIAKGDFGYSAVSGASVNQLLSDRFPATLILVILGSLISTIIGITFGFISALRRNKPIDYTLTSFGMIGISVPGFFFAMVFILVFAVYLGWLPTGGRSSIGDKGFFDTIKYYILPSICLGINLTATFMRFTRNSMLDVMNKDYMKTARAKGLTECQVNIKHCFRNGSTPVMITVISRISLLVSGAVIIETVFNYPGIGSLMVQAIEATDIQIAMSILLIITAIILVSCFVADIFLALLDPRIRFNNEEEAI